MRILVLDDNEIIRRAPADYFVDPHDYREDEFVQTMDVKEFVRLFFTEEWDQVWIDHDLGSGRPTGRDATKDIYNYICGSNRKVKRIGEVWVTTMNPSASNNMVSDLIKCSAYLDYVFKINYVPIGSLHDYGITRGALLPWTTSGQTQK